MYSKHKGQIKNNINFCGREINANPFVQPFLLIIGDTSSWQQFGERTTYKA